MRNVVAWNEINHFTQPTYKNPKAAAKFTTIARKVFKGGTVVTADILDQADNVRAKHPTFRSATAVHQGASARRYKGPRSICGVHNYSDINRFRQTGTKAHHQGARLQADLAHRGRRHLQVRGLQGLPERAS